MDFSDKIDNIELKIRQLALKMGRLQEENATLKGENESLKAEIDRQKGTVDALKDKLSKTQGVLEQQREGQTEYSKQLKQQIDQYISEIDRCIEWLNNNEQRMDGQNTKQITVLIAGRPYPLKIKEGDEPTIRKIVKEVNDKINKFQLTYANKDKQDCLSMAILTYAVDFHKSSQAQKTTQTPNTIGTKLSQIDEMLDKLLV